MNASSRFDFAAAGYDVPAGPPESWRTYDPNHPDPGYFEFDWLSARHPDLYDASAVHTDACVAELREIVDVSARAVCDVGAGTGRATIAIAPDAAHVFAVDIYRSVVTYGIEVATRAAVENVSFMQADRSQLPLPENAVDAVICAWAELDFREAARVLRPNGLLVQMGTAPGALAGELSPVLARDYPALITEVGPTEWWSPGCAPHNFEEPMPRDLGIDAVDDLRHVHEFTSVSQYESVDELATIVARIYGARAGAYFRDRGQSTFSWRQRITWCRVASSPARP